MIKIMPCTCVHPYQDAKYGIGRRVHNGCGSNKGSHGHRCTSCGAEKTSSTLKVASVAAAAPQAGTKK